MREHSSGKNTASKLFTLHPLNYDRPTRPRSSLPIYRLLYPIPCNRPADPRSGVDHLEDRTMSAWISADKLMPDTDSTVLIATENGEVEAGYDDGQDWRYLSGGKVDSPVTHWMPFPEPPEGAK